MKSAAFPIMMLAAAQIAVSGGAAAAQSSRSCPQALAGYSSADQRVGLEFSGALDMSFSLLVDGLDGKYDGFTYPAEGADGTEGVVLDNCPDGDATGEEIAACTVWQGQVKAIDADEMEGDLPMSGASAAAGLHLEGLSAALAERLPDLFSGAPDDSLDTLTLSACQE